MSFEPVTKAYYSSSESFLEILDDTQVAPQRGTKADNRLRRFIVDRIGEEACAYFELYSPLDPQGSYVVSTTDVFNIDYNADNRETIINLQRINDIRFINKFFEHVNQKLKEGHTFIGCVETFTARESRKRISKVPILRSIYFSLEFIFLRVFPKVALLNKFYFFITRGKGRLLSKAETLGRLVCCGFDIVDYQSFNGLLYFVAEKRNEPKYDMSPSYGPLYKMPRLGKKGKTIGIYKLRTMHPYAEYLQDYMLRTYGYGPNGKPANDFRLTPWGKIMRKYWLDELPQLINFIKGELKLVGVRPISQRYFQDIPKDLQKLRLKQKPGCIPPYVALDRKSNVEEVLQAEREYLKEKLRRPFTTDTRYFFKAIWNIVVRSKRGS